MDCKYHDNKKANWNCEACDTPFCMDCVEVESGTIAPRCILCRRYLTRLAVSDQIDPFWNRLSQFNSYPFQKGAKSFLMFYAVIALVLGFLIDLIPIFLVGLVLKLTLFAVLVSYIFSVLSRTAKGDFIAPKYDQTITYDSDGMTIKVIWLSLILLGIGFLSAKTFGLTGLIIYQIILAVAMPAILVTLGMSKHLSFALSPVYILRTMVSIGFPYLILVAFTALIFFSLAFATGFIEYWLPDPVVFFITKTIEALFYIMLFNMLGYVVYQYHAELGYGVDVEQLATNENIQLSPEIRALAHADVYIQEGRYEDAKHELMKAGANIKHQEQAYNKLVRLFIAQNDNLEMLKAAKLYFENPNLNLHGFAAWQLYLQVKKHEVRFRPMNANARAVLINQIRSKKLIEELQWLTDDLIEKFNQDIDLPKALLAEAKYYADIEHNDQKALQKLESLLQNFPQGEHCLEAENLIKTYKAMA